MLTDPIADFLTRIRNALMMHHTVLSMPSSSFKEAICKVLKDKGYIRSYRVLSDKPPQGVLQILLKYDRETQRSVITSLTRISKPSLRKYVGVMDLPRVLNGLGIAVLSTSKGVMSDKEARKEGIGGEVICYVH